MNQLYNNLKFFQFPDHIEAFKHKKAIAPIHIRLKPTNRCNHDCSYCAYRNSDLQLGSSMDLKSEIPRAKMIQLLEDFGQMNIKAVTLSGGGEPLLYPHIKNLITGLSKKNISLGIISNGALLEGEVAHLVATYADWIRISIDGYDEKSYAEIRHVSEKEFTRVLTNIENFSSAKCLLSCNIVVSHHNAPHLATLCQRLHNAGVNHLKISRAIISDNNAQNQQYHQEISHLVEQQLASVKDLPIVNHYHEPEQIYQKEYTLCPFLQFLTVIGADCKVYSCQDKAYCSSGVLGDFTTTSFKELWYSKELQEKIYSLNPSIDCKNHCVTDTKNRAIYNFLSINKDHAYFV